MGVLGQATRQAAGKIIDLSGDADVLAVPADAMDVDLEPGTGLLVLGVKARFPATCPDDGLDHLGDTMDLVRYPGEMDVGYRARLGGAFDSHAWDGTAKGIQDQEIAMLSGAGAPAPDALVLEDWQSAFADDSEGIAYSRFVTMLRGTPWTPSLLGTMTLGAVLGSTATPTEVAIAKRIVRKGKDAHALPILVRVALADVDLLGVDFALGTSILANDEDANDWIMMRRLGVDFELGTAQLATYEI